MRARQPGGAATPVIPMTAESDAAIVARAQAGDADAFSAFVERYRARVFRWAVGLVGDRDDADDVTQEVFVRLHGRLHAYRPTGSLDGWIYTVVRTVVARTRTKERRRARLGALPAAQRSQEVYLTDPGARVDREAVRRLMLDALLALPLRQREVFDLCDLQGRTPAEVAELLGLKQVSVRASLFKARGAIRRVVLSALGTLAEDPA